MPRVSVIIPVYNLEKYIEETLNSVKAQTFCDFECIVVDDGSTDASLTRIQNFCSTDSRFYCISQENSGVSSARNTGMQHATGDYVAFLDGDDLWDPRFLEALLQYLQCHPEVELIHCLFTMFDDATGVLKPHVWKNYQRTGNIWWDMAMHAEFCMGAWLARRESLQRAGSFTTGWTIAEDRDYLLRLLECIGNHTPPRVAEVPEVLLYYRQRAQSAVRNAALAVSREWEIMQPHLEHPGIPACIRRRAYSFLAFKMAVINLFALHEWRAAARWYLNAIRYDWTNYSIYLLPVRKILLILQIKLRGKNV